MLCREKGLYIDSKLYIPRIIGVKPNDIDACENLLTDEKLTEKDKPLVERKVEKIQKFYEFLNEGNPQFYFYKVALIEKG